MTGISDRLNMTLVVDWYVKPQIKQNNKKINKILTFFFKITPSFRGISVQKFAEKLRESSRSFSAKSRGEKNGLRELTRNLAEFSPRKFAFENFCSWSEREKRAFFLG